MEITLSFAQELICNYRQNHWNYLNEGCPSLSKGQVDSRSVWFDINHLQAFLQQVAPQQFPPVVPPPVAGQCDGIRFYFGEYSQDMINAAITAMESNLTGNKATDEPLQSKIAYMGQCSGLHTLIMIPTIPGPNNTHVDYDFISGSSDFATIAADDTISAMNHGHLAPPPYEAHGVPGGQPGYDDMALGATLMVYCDTGL